MKVFVAIFAIFAVTTLEVTCDPLYISNSEVRLSNAFERICPESKDPIMKAVKKAEECLTTTYKKKGPICNKARAIPNECLKPVKEAYEECLPEESKNVPATIVDIYKAGIEHICTAPTEETVEFFNGCLWSMLDRTEEFENTTKQFEEKMEEFSRDPTKKKLCRALTSVEEYMRKNIDTNCGNVTTKAVMGLYEDMVKPCNDIDM